MSFRPVELHFYHIKINRWVKTNQIAVFCHVITNLYNSLLKKKMIYNDKWFQFDQYNIILLRKLGNITYNISSFFLFMK